MGLAVVSPAGSGRRCRRTYTPDGVTRRGARSRTRTTTRPDSQPQGKWTGSGQPSHQPSGAAGTFAETTSHNSNNRRTCPVRIGRGPHVPRTARRTVPRDTCSCRAIAVCLWPCSDNWRIVASVWAEIMGAPGRLSPAKRTSRQESFPKRLHARNRSPEGTSRQESLRKKDIGSNHAGRNDTRAAVGAAFVPPLTTLVKSPSRPDGLAAKHLRPGPRPARLAGGNPRAGAGGEKRKSRSQEFAVDWRTGRASVVLQN